ncbi:TPA: hypothetical protein I7181_13295 [Vibrio vulnificus]|nr:hypothetical protein [Vibrio vulnificus]
MNNDTNREPDGYIYNSRRNIRTNDRIERLYRDKDDNYLAFIYSVEYKNSEGKWWKAGSRRAFNSLDTADILDNGFRDFPSTYK